MHWIDWLIVSVPLLAVAFIGYRTQRYVKGVSDFLTAGRVAGRYVICVAGAEASMGLISLVAMFEAYYRSGFAYGSWGAIAAPIGMVMGLTGYCVCRFMETRAMTFEFRQWGEPLTPAPLERIAQQYEGGKTFVERTITWEYGHFLGRQQVGEERYESFRAWNLPS